MRIDDDLPTLLLGQVLVGLNDFLADVDTFP